MRLRGGFADFTNGSKSEFEACDSVHFAVTVKGDGSVCWTGDVGLAGVGDSGGGRFAGGLKQGVLAAGGCGGGKEGERGGV